MQIPDEFDNGLTIPSTRANLVRRLARDWLARCVNDVRFWEAQEAIGDHAYAGTEPAVKARDEARALLKAINEQMPEEETP